MTTIKAPFNFVPLNDKVFYPKWANYISHDIPFEDGESGTIEIELTALSPLFVRNGHTKNDAEEKNEIYKSFSIDPDGNYFIPATSIKGMVRNVLEIISFGKMTNISNDRFSIRDLKLKKYLDFFQNSEINCGWMTKNRQTIKVISHGIPRRISHSELDKTWKTDFTNIFKRKDILKVDENRTAFYKINLCSGKDFKGSFIELPLNKDNTVDKRIKVKFDNNGSFKGTIVLTGQPGVRMDKGDLDKSGKKLLRGIGKFYEFVFPETEVQTVLECDYHEDSGIFKDFCFVHKESIDWKYWKKEMEAGKPVPVFFSMKNGKMQHMGLSYLYKLPFKKTIKEYLPPEHNDSKADLSECMFGNSSPNSTKGRVQFLNLKLKEGKVSENIKEPYMGSPKPSYYPIYLVQEGNNGIIKKPFTTMLDDSARLRGWKRYPVHNDLEPFIIPKRVSEKNLNPFYPINVGAIFTGIIHFHNLKKVEIGALLKSIALRKSGFHTLGFAKPYGFGKVEIAIKSIKGTSLEPDEYRKSFTELMEGEIPGYLKSKEVKELEAMSIPQTIKSELSYMELPEFAECKRKSEYLENYSDLIIEKEKTENIVFEEEAEIRFFKKPYCEAFLISGKDKKSKPVEDLPSHVKLKIGDRIIVRKVMHGGNVKSLSFIKVVK